MLLSSVVADILDFKSLSAAEMCVINCARGHQVLLYFFCLAAWIAGNLVFLRSRPPGERLRGLAIGVIYASILERGSLSVAHEQPKHARRLGRVGMLAGSLAGNVFCLKAFVELLQVGCCFPFFALARLHVC